MSLIRTPFKDAAVPEVPRTPSGSKKDTAGTRQLPSGLPGRDGGLLEEVLYDNVAPDPKYVDLSRHDFKLKI